MPLLISILSNFITASCGFSAAVRLSCIQQRRLKITHRTLILTAVTLNSPCHLAPLIRLRPATQWRYIIINLFWLIDWVPWSPTEHAIEWSNHTKIPPDQPCATLRTVAYPCCEIFLFLRTVSVETLLTKIAVNDPTCSMKPVETFIDTLLLGTHYKIKLSRFSKMQICNWTPVTLSHHGN